LVDQERPLVVFHRRANDWEPERLTGLEEILTVMGDQVSMPLAEIYEGVDHS
jgi:hypothetical protein